MGSFHVNQGKGRIQKNLRNSSKKMIKVTTSIRQKLALQMLVKYLLMMLKKMKANNPCSQVSLKRKPRNINKIRKNAMVVNISKVRSISNLEVRCTQGVADHQLMMVNLFHKKVTRKMLLKKHMLNTWRR